MLFVNQQITCTIGLNQNLPGHKRDDTKKQFLSTCRNCKYLLSAL